MLGYHPCLSVSRMAKPGGLEARAALETRAIFPRHRHLTDALCFG